MGIFGKDRQRTTAEVAARMHDARPANPVRLVKGDGPAVPRTTVENQGGVSLVKKYDKAALALSKRELTGVRAEAVLYLDCSGSMSGDYGNGNVQLIVERALGFALQIDGDGSVPVIGFGDALFREVTARADEYKNAAASVTRQGRLGFTNMAAALHDLLQRATETTTPLFAIVVTDGSPYVPGDPGQADRCTELVRELSKYPVFLKFLSVRPVDYLNLLDDMGGRLVDNCDAKDVPNPQEIRDLDFAEKMLDEWNTWIEAATAAGVIRS